MCDYGERRFFCDKHVFSLTQFFSEEARENRGIQLNVLCNIFEHK